jgi:hypothetical protein
MDLTIEEYLEYVNHLLRQMDEDLQYNQENENENE